MIDGVLTRKVRPKKKYDAHEYGVDKSNEGPEVIPPQPANSKPSQETNTGCDQGKAMECGDKR